MAHNQDPDRRHLKLLDWPSLDRQMWDALVKPGTSILDENGAFAKLRPRSRTKKLQSYAAWLGFIMREKPALLEAAPAVRVTPQVFRAWHTRSWQQVAPYTTLLRAVDLMTIMVNAYPSDDWGWLRAAVQRIQHDVTPLPRKAGRIRPTRNLLELGLGLMSSADDRLVAAGGIDRQGWFAARHRDGLAIALLALRPVRLRNLLHLEIGRTLLKVGGGAWQIVYDGIETKTHEPIDVPWPDVLVQPLLHYLSIHRVRLLGGSVSQALWISRLGTKLSEGRMRQAFMQHTRDKFGVTVTPHLFRDCAATTQAIEDPGHIGIASSLLGHSSLSTTDKHYRQASSIIASRFLSEVVQAARQSSRPEPQMRRNSHPPARPASLPLFQTKFPESP